MGEYLLARPDIKAGDAVERGKALQTLLQEAHKTLAEQDEEGAYFQRLIELTFFIKCQSTVKITAKLNVSRAAYFRHRPQAIKRLEQALIQRLNPVLRLESPPAPQKIVGRAEVLAACLESLRQGRTVGLVGPGGIGKTMLGVHLAAALAPRPAFWFTLRLNLTDRLSNLLFSLGYFLHGLGASSLWLQLVADQGQTNWEVALGLIPHDLESLEKKQSPPLLCFDEVDLLHPAEVEAHDQIRAFLQSLRGLAPLLFIGQQLSLETDVQHSLAALPQSEIEELLEQAQIQLSPADLALLQNHTQENPRLLELFITLHRAGEPISKVLPKLAGAPSVERLLRRILDRLAENEQELLVGLAVFRRPAPGDAWDGVVLQQLINRHLVQADSRGVVVLLPAFKAVMYNKLPPENRHSLHLTAAAIRAARGEYTAAAYHYLNGGQARIAIWLWREHQQQEINQGQAEAALALFREISTDQLKGVDRDALTVLRSSLYKLGGDYKQAGQGLDKTFWDSPVLKAQARRLAGDIAELNSQFETALKAYQQGLQIVSGLLEGEKAQFHKNLGWIYMRQRNPALAWREARLARYEAENLQGHIQAEMGHFATAQSYYLEALALAEEMGHTEGEAKTRDNLAILLTRQEKFKEAEAHWEQAGQYYQRIGRKTRLAGVKVNLAFLHNLSGRPQAAISPAKEAMTLFEQLGESYGQAVAAQNLAEAYQALGNLERAEHFARQVYQTEEDSTIPDCLRVLGEVKLAQKKYAEAEQFIRQSIKAAQQNRDKYLEAYAQRALGRLYDAQRQKSKAKAAFEQAIKLFEELELPQEIKKTNRG